MERPKVLAKISTSCLLAVPLPWSDLPKELDHGTVLVPPLEGDPLYDPPVTGQPPQSHLGSRTWHGELQVTCRAALTLGLSCSN